MRKSHGSCYRKGQLLEPQKFFKYCVAAKSISCPRNLAKEFTGGFKSEKKRPKKGGRNGEVFSRA